MKYFVGSFITFLGMLFFYVILSNITQMPNKKLYKYSQSHIHSLVYPLLPPKLATRKELNTQSSKHLKDVQIRVIIVGPDAFWIKDNVLYTAKVTKEGVDKDTTLPVDTIGMDSVELDKMIFIVDQLRSGQNNDSWDSGNK